MALIRWEPVAELNTIQNEMNRLFNTVFDQPHHSGRGNGTGRRWLPPMDLVETADHYVLPADLPGLSDGDVDVQLEDNVLTISGERKAEHEDQQEGYYRLERAFGAFSRALTLPDGVDPDGVQAAFEAHRLGPPAVEIDGAADHHCVVAKEILHRACRATVDRQVAFAQLVGDRLGDLDRHAALGGVRNEDLGHEGRLRRPHPRGLA